MEPNLLPREQVARALAVSHALLLRYEAHGLVRPLSAGGVEGYGPAEVRRAWAIVTYQRDLGVNLAGVEAILKLRDHLADVHSRLDAFATRFREALDDEDRRAGLGADD